MNEQIARLEAKLRGGTAVSVPAIRNGVTWFIDVPGEPDDEPRYAADPATPEGREWWEQALNIQTRRNSAPDMGGKDWSASIRHPRVYATGKTPGEARQAAVEAAALADVPPPEQQREPKV